MQMRLGIGGRFPSAPTMLILAGVFAFPMSAGGQQLGNKAETEEPFFKVRTKFNEQLEALKPFNAKEHEPVAELAAKYHTYRVTWVAVQGSKEPNISGLPEVQDAFLKVMEKSVVTDKSGMKTPKNKEFMRVFAKALISCFQEVLDQDLRSSPQAVTTASLMLPTT